MSQKTRATGASSWCQGRSWKVFGSGRASTSLSWTRLKPSMAEPSKVIPSSRAFSSSAGVMLNALGVPRTSVNQSWTKRMPRSSTVRSTYSCWLLMGSVHLPGTWRVWAGVVGSIPPVSQVAVVRSTAGRGAHRAGPDGPGSVGASDAPAGRWRPAGGQLPAASPQTVSTMTAVTS